MEIVIRILILAALALNLTAADLERALKTHLDEFAPAAGNPAKSVTTRDLANAALLNLMTGGDPSRSEAWIERAYATQDMDPASKTFGELKWNTGDAEVTDMNAIEFGTQAIGPLFLTYRDRLSAGFRKRMEPHLKAALAGLHGHRVPVSYTNIFLMNLVSGMLIGQASHDDDAVRQARQQLDAWIEYTNKAGIHEFDSPTYYACDLNSLVEGFRYAAATDDRRKFERALDYFWTDIAASFLPGAHRIVGPYSRDYDFLRGRGGMDVWLTDAGWASIPAKSLDFEKVFVLDNARAGGYRAKPETASLTQRLPREVVSTWDEDTHHGRFLWLGHDVALGCTSGNYNAQDKLFNATFAGSADLPQISIVPDVFDAPYGLVKNPDRTGHMKPTHLPLHAACVAHGGTALITLDLDPSAVAADARGFATNILMPAAADIAVDGKRQKVSEPGSTAVDPKAIVSVTVGAATVAVRIVHVDGTPALALQADPDGLAHHAVRFKIAHLAAGEQSKSKHLRVTLLIAAREGAEAANLVRDVRAAKVADEVRDGIWTARAALPALSLEVGRDAADRKKIVSQLVNGEAVAPAPLSVDGKPTRF